jgi:putative ABC transport system ATP-binding protein
VATADSLMDDLSASTVLAPCCAPVIHSEGLSHWFGEGETRSRALSDITLEIDEGEVVILTGPSGSGKTTLLTLIGGLRKVQEGTLTILGRDLSRVDSRGLVRHRSDIGFIFQQHNLFSSLTAIENVRMATALKPGPVHEMNERATAILERLGMGSRLHYLPSHLSGGQRQRVAIARALVNSPRLVLADEPTASLDARSGQDVMDILNELATGPIKATVLIVTHDQRLLDRAHRIVNMVSGRLVSNVQPSRIVVIGEALQAHVEALRDLDAPMLTRVVEHMKVQRLPAGKVIVREGEPGEMIYVILGGEAEVLDHDGRVKRTLHFGDAFGRITALSGRRSEFTVRSRTPLEVATLSRQDAETYLAADKDFHAAVRQYLMARQ